MTITMVTPENAPRDYAALLGLSRAVRYRLILTMGVQPHSEEESAFMKAAPDVQSQTVLAMLQRRDAETGQPPMTSLVMGQPTGAAPQPMQMAPQQMAPQPMQQQPQYQPQPQPTLGGVQMAPPMQTQPVQMAPQPMQLVPQRQPQPATIAMGGTPAPMQQRQPQTPADPGNNGNAVLSTLTRMHQALEAVNKALGDRASSAEVEDLRNLIVGLGRTQSLMFILLLELGEKTLEMDKGTLCRMVAAASDQGEPENLLNATLGGQGKG